MIYVLKIILTLLIIAISLIARLVYLDYKKTKQTDGFDELSIFEKTKFNVTFFSMIFSMTSLLVFLFYFLFVKIKIG